MSEYEYKWIDPDSMEDEFPDEMKEWLARMVDRVVHEVVIEILNDLDIRLLRDKTDGLQLHVSADGPLNEFTSKTIPFKKLIGNFEGGLMSTERTKDTIQSITATVAEVVDGHEHEMKD